MDPAGQQHRMTLTLCQKPWPWQSDSPHAPASRVETTRRKRGCPMSRAEEEEEEPKQTNSVASGELLLHA